MFTSADHAKIKTGFLTAFNLACQTATIEKATPPHTVTTIKVGHAIAGADDTEVINAYGIGSVILTFDAIEVTPEKFDQVTVGANKLTIDAVKPVKINDEIIFYRAFTKGNN